MEITKAQTIEITCHYRDTAFPHVMCALERASQYRYCTCLLVITIILQHYNKYV